KGGPRTNRHGQVLRPDRSVIGGLYSAGLAAASPIGTKAVGAGTTIGPYLTFGYVAGKAIARRNV
ncbi:MAG: FAD-binding protein, partial [Reyranella sp.]|nr:FAD-binding protein [Reyranella sp.]